MSGITAYLAEPNKAFIYLDDNNRYLSNSSLTAASHFQHIPAISYIIAGVIVLVFNLVFQGLL